MVTMDTMAHTHIHQSLNPLCDCHFIPSKYEEDEDGDKDSEVLWRHTKQNNMKPPWKNELSSINFPPSWAAAAILFIFLFFHFYPIMIGSWRHNCVSTLLISSEESASPWLPYWWRRGPRSTHTHTHTHQQTHTHTQASAWRNDWEIKTDQYALLWLVTYQHAFRGLSE